MNTLLRRIPAAAAWVAALLLAPVAHAVSVVINTPANGTNLPPVSSPAGVTVSATASLTGGATAIVSVDFKVNGTSIGTVAGSLTPSVTWTPTAPGTYTLTATAVDNGPAVSNTATSSSVIVTVSSTRVLSLVAPTSGASVPQNSSFFLRSTASMSDAVVGSVEFFVNAVSAGTVTRAPYNLAHTTALAPGAYNVFARATLTDGFTTVDSVTNTLNVVTATGTAPTVSLTAPSTGSFAAVNSSVTLSAVASDLDGFIPTTAPGGVTFYVDGDPVGTDLTAPYSVTWTPLAAKSYSIRALAIDDKGNQTLSNAVTVTAVAAMPTVSLTAPANNSTGSVGSAATLTASATASTGATVAGVTFFQNGVQIGVEDTSAPYTVSFTPATAGNYALTASVRDDAGITVTSSTVNYTATSAQPTIALTAPAAGATITVNTAATVTATATAGTGATISQVQFLLGGTTIIGTVTTAPYSISWTPTTTGNVSLTARVLDSSGASVTSSAVSATVVAAPTVSLTAPANNSSATVGSPVTVTASPTASPGATVSKVAFFVTPSGGAQSQIGADVAAAPYTVAWTPPSAGNFSLTAVVTDSTNQTGTSSAVAVAVVNSQPTVSLTAPGVGSVLTVGSNVSLAATATPGSGATIAQVQFLVTPSGATAAVVGTDTSAPYALTWVPTTAGNYTITARVTDTNGNTVTSTGVSVTAVTATSVALTAPANNSAATVGTATTVTASATPIAGATINSVSFTATVGGVPTALGTVNTAPYTIAWTPAAAGATTLTASATDSNGTTVTSSAITVNVAAAAPTVALSAPLNGVVVTVGSNVTVSANATPGTGATVSQVQFYAGSTLIAVDTSAPYSVTWVPTSAGAQNITARVVDSNGTTVTSTAVSVTAVTSTSVTITTPAANAAATVGTATTVTASATATAGATIQSVTFFATPSGGAAVQIGLPVAAAPYTVAWTPAVAGAYTLTAVALDSANTSVTSSGVAVTAGNSLPTAALTAPQPGALATVGLGTTLTANVAPGSGGATVTQVQFLAGSTVVATLPGAVGVTSYSTTWTPTSAANVALTVKVTDSNGNTTTSSAVNVTAVTTAPVVTLVTPTAGQTLGVGATVSLSATASATAPATVSRVDFVAGGNIVATALAPTAGAYTASWTPTASGVTTLAARVTDSNGTVVNTAAINVNIVGPAVAITSPTNASVVGSGSSVSLTATASAVGSATVSRVDYFAGTAFIASSTTAPNYPVTWTASPTGAVNLTARVVDSNGVTVTSSIVSVTVSAFAPSVALTAPVNGASVGLGASTTLTATASAAAGLSVSKVEFLAGTLVVGTALNAPYSASWTPAAAGIVALTARVTDSVGTIVTSGIVNVNVTAPSVAITSPATGSTAGFANPVTLTATASAVAPATVAKVDFYSGSTFITTATAGAGGTYSASWTPTATGTQSITARVTDSNGAVVISTAISVIVSTTPPVATLTSPSTGSSFVVGVPVALTATATAGGGANVARVDFLSNSSTVLGTALVPVGGVYSITWTPTTATNVLNLSARVTDSNNAVDTSNVVTVSVTSSTTLGVALSVTGGSATVPVGSTRFLTATVSGLAAIAQVEFFLDGQSLGVDTSAPFALLFTAPNNPGARVLTARATDGTGGVATSPNVALTIAGAVGTPPSVGVLAPVSGAFVPVNSATTVSGVVTDPDANISTVQVFANGVSVGNATISGSAWSISWTPSTLGSVSLAAIATDGTGNSIASPAVGVSVVDAQSPAVSLSLSPRTGATAASTTLPSGAVRNFVADATASSGRAVVRVEFFVDGTKAGEDTTAPYTFRYTAPELRAGELSRPLVISARATDNAGAARDTQLSLLVISPVGAPPQVSLLTPARTVSTVPGTAITLAASATSLVGTVSSVQFYVNGSPAPVNGGNGLTSAPYVSSFTPTTPGTYVIDAIATDDRGNTAVSNSATITAAYTVPSIAISAPNPNATARLVPNVPVTLTATATVQIGAGSSVLLVEFLLDGQQIAARTTPSNSALGTYSATWIPTTALIGNHVLTARVTDTNSQSATSSAVNVVIANAVGTPPTVTIATSPIPGPGLQTLSQVNFIANAFANGVNTSINNVEFFLNDQSIGLAAREQATNLYRLTYDFSRIDFATAPVNPNNPSQYILPLYAIARDSNNNQTVSATSNLAINPATSAAPVISFTAITNTTVTQGSQIFFAPFFSDSDGTVTQISLFANGVAVQNLGSPISGQSVFTYNASTAGRYNVYAVATDDTGNTAVASPAILVQVNAVNA
ncbi:MAG: Ig-like domain-containing protein, partial [Opitutaceae bacterium]